MVLCWISRLNGCLYTNVQIAPASAPPPPQSQQQVQRDVIPDYPIDRTFVGYHRTLMRYSVSLLYHHIH